MLTVLHHAASLYHNVTHLQHTYAEAQDDMASNIFAQATETVERLRLRLPLHLSKPRVAIVCGSGLGGLADVVNKDEESVDWAYKDVPGFSVSTGELSFDANMI